MRADNVVFPEFLVGEDPLPHQAEFVRLFHKEYGRFPKILEALGWGAVHVILTAFKKAGVGAETRSCARRSEVLSRAI